MADLRISGFSKSFGGQVVLPPLDLHVPNGSFTVLVGPSGCGKSTLLRLIAGLDDPDDGILELEGRDITFEEPANRRMAMVFQSYALYPHMTVAQNIEFGLKLARVPGTERQKRVAEAARALQLEALLNRKPAALSGGQRQRVAIGRAIVRDPAVFLFDEPLSNLDAALRAQMRVELAELHARLGATMIYVTHDQVEAMTLADQIVVMNAGRVEQIGAPMALYAKPATRFVAEFLGSPRMNISEGPAAQSMSCHAVGFRPEALTLVDAGTPDAWTARIRLVERLGAETVLHASAQDFGDLVIRLQGAPEIGTDKVVHIQPDLSQAHRFDHQGRRIS